MPRKKKPRRRDSRNTNARMSAFLKAYSETCNLLQAAKRAGIERRTHYFWLEKPRYAAEFAQCKRLAADYLESEAVRRAAKGWLEPVMYQGTQVSTVRRYDGGLMQFLLRGMMPEKYGARTEVSGPQGKPIEARIEVVFVKPKPE